LRDLHTAFYLSIRFAGEASFYTAKEAQTREQDYPKLQVLYRYNLVCCCCALYVRAWRATIDGVDRQCTAGGQRVPDIFSPWRVRQQQYYCTHGKVCEMVLRTPNQQAATVRVICNTHTYYYTR